MKYQTYFFPNKIHRRGWGVFVIHKIIICTTYKIFNFKWNFTSLYMNQYSILYVELRICQVSRWERKIRNHKGSLTQMLSQHVDKKTKIHPRGACAWGISFTRRRLDMNWWQCSLFVHIYVYLKLLVRIFVLYTGCLGIDETIMCMFLASNGTNLFFLIFL